MLRDHNVMPVDTAKTTVDSLSTWIGSFLAAIVGAWMMFRKLRLSDAQDSTATTAAQTNESLIIMMRDELKIKSTEITKLTNELNESQRCCIALRRENLDLRNTIVTLTFDIQSFKSYGTEYIEAIVKEMKEDKKNDR